MSVRDCSGACLICEDNTDELQCCVCWSYLHRKCADISASLAKQLAKSNIRWHCLTCNSKLADMLQCKRNFETFSNSLISSIDSKLTAFKQDIIESTKTHAPLPSQARSVPSINTATSMGGKPSQPLADSPVPRPTYAVVLKSKDTSPLRPDRIAPLLRDVPIVASRQTAKGGLVIKCASPRDAEKALSSAAADPQVDAHRPRATPLRPKVTLAHVPLELEPESFVAHLRRKNSALADLPEDAIKLLFFTRVRSGTRHAVLSLTPSARTALRTAGDRLYVDLRLCSAYDRFWVSRCARCAGLGHSESKCSRTEVCGHCAGPHRSSECDRSAPDKCTNCMISSRPHTHSSFNSSCPSFISVRHSIRLRTAVSDDLLPPSSLLDTPSLA